MYKEGTKSKPLFFSFSPGNEKGRQGSVDLFVIVTAAGPDTLLNVTSHSLLAISLHVGNTTSSVANVIPATLYIEARALVEFKE